MLVTTWYHDKEKQSIDCVHVSLQFRSLDSDLIGYHGDNNTILRDAKLLAKRLGIPLRTEALSPPYEDEFNDTSCECTGKDSLLARLLVAADGELRLLNPIPRRKGKESET